MNSNSRFVEIKPVGYYFFGNERTSRTVNKDKYKQTVMNYFASSNLLPQQTALLGMLRYAILAWQDMLNAPITDKEKIIGAGNFHFEKDTPYGWIERISPLVLFKTETKEVFLPVGMDHQKYKGSKTGSSVQDVTLYYSSLTEKHYSGKVDHGLPVLNNYVYKEDMHSFWYSEKGESLSEKDIFKSITKVGVDKEKKDEAFYKQTFHGLNKGFSFGLWIDFTESADISKLTKNEIIVPFGADQGMFRLKLVDDIDSVFQTKDKPSTKVQKVVLMSDSWITDDFFNQIEFGITDYIDFRYIFSAKQNYYQMKEDAIRKNQADIETSMAAKSDKFVLMKRGSVIYPTPHFDFILLDHPAFQRIGYNIYKTI
jgi:CRISPR-associated protein Cmr3